MQTQTLARPPIIVALLILQIVPLLLFPPASFASTTQEWWLPALLTLLVLIADFQLIVRHTVAPWPWYLLSFAQGFNIISRLMMLWSHANTAAGGMNWLYVFLAILSMLLSAFFLWYFEKPSVRVGLLH